MITRAEKHFQTAHMAMHAPEMFTYGAKLVLVGHRCHRWACFHHIAG